MNRPFSKVTRRHTFAAFLLLLLMVPVAAAQSGYTTTIQVTDEDKHVAPKDKDITYVRYRFAYSQGAANPQAASEADRVGAAWLLLNVEHQYHDGRFFHFDVTEDNTLVVNVYYNQMKIVYEASIHVEDAGWNLKRLVTEGYGVSRGSVTVHYRVYNELNVLVADETETTRIYALEIESIPDSRLWIEYENRTLTISPDFTAVGILPQYLDQHPPDNPGKVQVFNTTFQDLEVEIIATKQLREVHLGFGFSRPGTTPGYSLKSIAEDVLTNVRSASIGLFLEVLSFIISLLPGGDKILIVQEYVKAILEATWVIIVQDPFLLSRAIIIFALGTGLLLYIDPMFLWLLKPPWLLLKGIWKTITFTWEFTMKVVSLISGRLGFGGK